MSKILNLSVFSLLFLTIWATPINAYWLENKPEPFTMHGEREQAPPSSRKGIFTVQDNFNLFTRQDGNNPILLPDSDYFIAADSINANLPVFGIFSHPAKPAGDPIANLIYANLKLKKLIDDYTKLQEKAKKLLSYGYSRVPAVTMQFTETIPIHQESNLLANKFSTINPTVLTSDSPQARPSVAASQTGKSIITLATLNRRHQSQQLTNQRAADNILKTSRRYATSGNNHSNQNYSQQTKPAEKTNSNEPYSNPASSTMLTILEMPFKIFRYIITHKITSLFIFFFILMIIKVIFGTRS